MLCFPAGSGLCRIIDINLHILQQGSSVLPLRVLPGLLADLAEHQVVAPAEAEVWFEVRYWTATWNIKNTGNFPVLLILLRGSNHQDRGTWNR